ncbi:MAG: NAD-dependent epimerase/dehydratase family protein [Pseudomonadota bacterium]
MGRTVWITGASGFTGKHLTEVLRAADPNDTLILIDRHTTDVPGCVSKTVDLSDEDAVKALAQAYPPSQIYHLAGLVPPADAAALFAVNVAMTQTVLKVLASTVGNTCRVLLVGSAAEYSGTPAAGFSESDAAFGASDYGRAKSAQVAVALQAAAADHLEVVVVRPFNLFGPGCPPTLVAGRLCQQIAAAGDELVMGNVSSSRDFIDIRDAVAGYRAIMADGKSGEAYNIATGTPTQIRVLVDTAIAQTNRRPELVIDASRFKADDVDVVYADMAKTFQVTDWRPEIPLATSLADMMRDDA